MKETLHIRINYDFAHLLFKPNEGKNIGTSVRVIEISQEDPRYYQIPIIAQQIKEENKRGYILGWEIKRKYSKPEIEAANLFHIKIKPVFEPAGEECGTLYDESVACEICGANRKQVSALMLKSGSIPKKDISRTIAGEVVVTKKFAEACRSYNMKGILFEPLIVKTVSHDYFQLKSTKELHLSSSTLAGVDPFDMSESNKASEIKLPGGQVYKMDKEIYKCPKGHTIGLNLLSEPYVLAAPAIKEFDFFSSAEKVGVKRGLLRPEPVYFCSPAFKKMVEEEKLTGFSFEIANIE